MNPLPILERGFCFTDTATRKVSIVAKQKRDRNILDDIAEQIEQVLNDLERLVNRRRKPAPVPVPIPVEHDPRRGWRDPRR